jgi:ABC-type sugar transport system permease subunit
MKDIDITTITSIIATLKGELTYIIDYTSNPSLRLYALQQLTIMNRLEQGYLENVTELQKDATALLKAAAELTKYQDKVNRDLEAIQYGLENQRDTAINAIENKKRMVQINTYYSNKYADYIFIAKLIILLCVIIIILSMLLTRSIISKGVYSFLVFIVCIIVIVIITYVWISMGNRDHVDYNKYIFLAPSNKSIRSINTKKVVGGYAAPDDGYTPIDNKSYFTYYGDEENTGAGSSSSTIKPTSKIIYNIF